MADRQIGRKAVTITQLRLAGVTTTKTKPLKVYYVPASRKGGIKRYVCPSIRPSRSYIEPHGLACPTSEWKFSTFDATRIPVSRSKGQRHTRPINAYTHRLPYLQTWYTDRGRLPASATGAMTSKVKGQGRKVTWSVWAVLEVGGGMTCRPNPAATLLV